jgi:hypothetical protein
MRTAHARRAPPLAVGWRRHSAGPRMRHSHLPVRPGAGLATAARPPANISAEPPGGTLPGGPAACRGVPSWFPVREAASLSHGVNFNGWSTAPFSGLPRLIFSASSCPAFRSARSLISQARRSASTFCGIASPRPWLRLAASLTECWSYTVNSAQAAGNRVAVFLGSRPRFAAVARRWASRGGRWCDYPG